MRELMQADAINGKKGRGYAKISGNNEELFFAKTIEATVELAKSEIKPIGKTMVGHKVMGESGSGSMTLYYLTPIFRSLLIEYHRTGIMPYIDLVLENDDPASSAGKQVVMLTGVCFDSITLSKLDGDSDDALEEDTDFTFEGYDILTPFKKI